MTPVPRWSDRPSRRTVLKLGGIVAGTSLLAQPVPAPDRTGPIRIDVQQEAINPDEHGRIPVRIRNLPAPARSTPDDVWFGHDAQFRVRGDVVLPENPEAILANPVRLIQQGHNGDHLAYFRSQDIDFSEAAGDEVTMGLGVVNGIFAYGTDTVRFTPGLGGESAESPG